MSAAEEPQVEPEEAEETTLEPPAEEQAEPAEEPTGEPVHPTEEPAAELGEKELEEALAKLEKEATRHRNRVSEIMGEDAQSLEPCPLCEATIPGFYWPGQVEAERQPAVLAAIGMGELAELERDPEAEECDLCDGMGELLTGSRVPTQRTRPCPKCGAKGWTNEQERTTWDSTHRAQEVAAELRAVAPGETPPASSLPAMDAWGRPVGHEFYGRYPAYMTEEQRARDVSGAV